VFCLFSENKFDDEDDDANLSVYSNISMHHALSPSLDSIAKSLDSVGSLGEFGEPGPDPTKFIEDGSFIGEYSFWVNERTVQLGDRFSLLISDF